MAQLTEIKRESKEVYEATLCSKIPKKYLNDFFAELIRQRGKMAAAHFLVDDEEGILAEAFDWQESVKGKEFWSNLENKMLTKAGMIVVKKEDAMLDICSEKLNNIRDKRSEELAAIHADMRKLLELLKQA
jgi:hypothetical protein